jgi:hypothetical protein
MVGKLAGKKRPQGPWILVLLAVCVGLVWAAFTHNQGNLLGIYSV